MKKRNSMKKQLFLALAAIGIMSASMQGASSDTEFTKLLNKKDLLQIQAFATYLILAGTDATANQNGDVHEDAPPTLKVLKAALSNVFGPNAFGNKSDFTKALEEFINSGLDPKKQYDDYKKLVLDRYNRAYEVLTTKFPKSPKAASYYGTDQALPPSLE